MMLQNILFIFLHFQQVQDSRQRLRLIALSHLSVR